MSKHVLVSFIVINKWFDKVFCRKTIYLNFISNKYKPNYNKILSTTSLTNHVYNFWASFRQTIFSSFDKIVLK